MEKSAKILAALVLAGYQIFLFVSGSIVTGFGNIMISLSIQHDPGSQVPTASIVFMSEVVKLFVAVSMLVKEIGFAQTKTKISQTKISKTISYAVPGLLWMVNNNLAFYALHYMDAVTASVLTKTKTLTTALLFRIVFRHPFTLQKHFAMLLLFGGSVLAAGVSYSDYGELDDVPEKPLSEDQLYHGLHITAFGIVCATIYVCLSAIAGVFYEWLMKKGPNSSESIHLQSIYLYSWGVVLNGLVYCTQVGTLDLSVLHVTKGYNMYHWYMVLLMALGGIIIAQIMKYANNIVKLFMSGMSALVTSFLSWVLFSIELPSNFLFAVFCVCTSLVLYHSPDFICVQKVPSEKEKVDRVEDDLTV